MTSPLIYAHFHQRALAWILDLFLLSAVLSPFLYLLNTFAATHLYDETGLILFRLLRLLLVFIVSLSALSWCTARFGGTPGKVLLGLQVIDSDTQHWLTPRRALLRILLSIPVIFSVLGILMMFLDGQHRAFHDRALNTLVIVKDHDYAEDPLPGDPR
jgi:uncharacterized RDD family membrane protein YckC